MTPEQLVALLSLLADLQRALLAVQAENASLREQLTTAQAGAA